MTTHTLTTAVERYLSALDDYRVDDLLEEFAPDALYIRPAFAADGSLSNDLEVVEGHAALRAFFDKRGRRPFVHLIRRVVRHGDDEFLEGILISTDGGQRSAFTGSATLDGEGRIRRYFTLASPVGDAGIAALDRHPAESMAGRGQYR